MLAAAKDDLPKLETVGTTYEWGIPSQGAIFDARDMTERFRFGGGFGEDFIRADRAKMREWLLTNVNVHWNKKFVRYVKITMALLRSSKMVHLFEAICLMSRW